MYIIYYCVICVMHFNCIFHWVSKTTVTDVFLPVHFSLK